MTYIRDLTVFDVLDFSLVADSWCFVPDLSGSLGDHGDNLRSLLQQMRTQAETLVPKIEDVKAEKMGDLIDQEMQETTDAIEQAAKRIAVNIQ